MTIALCAFGLIAAVHGLRRASWGWVILGWACAGVAWYMNILEEGPPCQH